MTPHRAFAYGSMRRWIGALLMGAERRRRYIPAVLKSRRRRNLLLSMALPLALAPALGGCLGYPVDGLAPTPPAGSEGSAASRLPTLLQQLGTTSGAVDFIDATPQSQVLGVQDVNGGKSQPSATVTEAVAGAKTPGTTTTPAATPTRTGTTAPNQPGTTSTPTPQAATPTPSAPALTPTPTPIAPTLTPTRTPTPTPLPPVEGGSFTPTPTPGGPPVES